MISFLLAWCSVRLMNFCFSDQTCKVLNLVYCLLSCVTCVLVETLFLAGFGGGCSVYFEFRTVSFIFACFILLSVSRALYFWQLQRLARTLFLDK